MTDLEIYRATVTHQPHRRFLATGGFVAPLADKIREHYGLGPDASIDEHFGIFRPVGIQPAGGEDKRDFSRYFEDMERPEGSFINSIGVLEVPAHFHHFTGYVSPLRNARNFKDLEQFPYLPTSGFDATGLAEQVVEAHRVGRVAATWVGHMYENSWQIRGYEEFLTDLVDRPEWCEYILDRQMERNLAIATIAARAGVDYFTTGDDVANQNNLMFSVPMWRRFMKARWARVYAAARAIKPDIQIWYHSDGNIWDIIPELIEIGVTILNPVQPECMDPVRVKQAFGTQIVMEGTVGTQTTMPFGTPADVAAVVRERKRTVGADGALILAPTHVLEPEVPLENIETFFRVAREE